RDQLDRDVPLGEERVRQARELRGYAQEGRERRAFVIAVDAAAGGDELAIPDAQLGELRDVAVRLPQDVFADDAAVRRSELDVGRHVGRTEEQQRRAVRGRDGQTATGIVRHVDPGLAQTRRRVAEQ